jgi:CHAD domain-containing protein
MQSANNSAVEHVRRAVIRHISRARKALRQPSFDDDAVHDARKDLKRARSGLRLLRPLDEAGYQRENMRLRNAARRLSAVRDDKVLLARLAELLAEEKKPARRQLLLALRKELRNERRRHWRALRSGEPTDYIEGVLATSARRVRKWRTPADADAAPADAVRRLYRQGRKALARSRKDPTDKQLHEARKKARHLGQALEIIAGKAPPKKAKKVLRRADDVGDLLGDDHDFAVVEARLLARPTGDPKAKKKLRARLEARRARAAAEEGAGGGGPAVPQEDAPPPAPRRRSGLSAGSRGGISRKFSAAPYRETAG